MPAVLVELDLRKRNCKKCGRWKHAIDFPWRWKARGRDLPIPYIGSVCSVCKAEKESTRYHTLSQEERHEKGRKANQQAVDRKNRLVAQVEDLEKRLARYRARISAPRRSKGDEILLDLLPLRMFLLREVRIHGSVQAIADTVQEDVERVRRHVNGYYWISDCKPRPIQTVTLGVVDEYLSRLNAEERLEDLYPEIDNLLDEFLARHQ